MRIEDDVLVTATGAEALSHVPRSLEEVEAVMAGQPWPPAGTAAAAAAAAHGGVVWHGREHGLAPQ